MSAKARYRGRHRATRPAKTRSRAAATARRGNRVRPLIGAGAAAVALAVLPAAAAHAAPGSLFPSAAQVRPPSDASTSYFSSELFATTCTGDRNCVAGGDYIDSLGRYEAFVATESHGSWSRGIKLLLPPTAAAQPNAEVNGLACRRAGNCIAVGGFNHDASNHNYALIATEVNGKWGRGFVPRPPANASGVVSYLNAVTCTAKGFCAAAGGYTDKAGHLQAMALVKPAGKRWKQAVEIRSPKGAATDPGAYMSAITCAAAGKCVAVGNYSVPGSGFPVQPMGAIMSGGTWRSAVRITLPANAMPGSYSALSAVSCRSGRCVAVGQYHVASDAESAMWVTESNGHFGAAKELTKAPADAAVVADTVLYGVSCPQSGPCLAAGDYHNTAGHIVAMYLTFASGRWTASTLTPPPNASATTFQGSVANSVSCTGAEHCTIAGWYFDTSHHYRSEAASTA